MSRMWDLDDIVTLTTIAREFGYAENTPIHWAKRYRTFPRFKLETSSALLYSRQEIIKWLVDTKRMAGHGHGYKERYSRSTAARTVEVA